MEKRVEMERVENFETEEELKTVWSKEYQDIIIESREHGKDDVEFEFHKQQQLYTKYSKSYDTVLRITNVFAPYKLAEKINELYEDKKKIKILDFGCGTGAVADNLKTFGFSDIDGADCNQDLLHIARQKNVMKKLFVGRGVEGLLDIPSDTYDVVCATGVFFGAVSYPGTECFEEICRIIKSGGQLIILAKHSYLTESYIDFDRIKKLEEDGILKSLPYECYNGYRTRYDCESDSKSKAVFMRYTVL